MNSESFDRALIVVLQFEGGYSNHPADRGGPTMRGVTQIEYDKWRRANLLEHRDVRAISELEVARIYRDRYWLPLRCDELQYRLALSLFDFGVNSGPRRALETLQALVGVTADGLFGPRTMIAVKLADQAELARQLLDERRAWLRSIAARRTSQRVFLQGWMNRCDQLSAHLI